jgi:hypothetical protein
MKDKCSFRWRHEIQCLAREGGKMFLEAHVAPTWGPSPHCPHHPNSPRISPHLPLWSKRLGSSAEHSARIQSPRERNTVRSKGRRTSGAALAKYPPAPLPKTHPPPCPHHTFSHPAATMVQSESEANPIHSNPPPLEARRRLCAHARPLVGLARVDAGLRCGTQPQSKCSHKLDVSSFYNNPSVNRVAPTLA